MVVVIVVTWERTIVVIEDEADQLCWIHQIQRFLHQPSWRFMGGHHHHKTVAPLSDDPAIGDEEQRRGINHDIVVMLVCLL